MEKIAKGKLASPQTVTVKHKYISAALSHQPEVKNNDDIHDNLLLTGTFLLQNCYGMLAA